MAITSDTLNEGHASPGDPRTLAHVVDAENGLMIVVVHTITRTVVSATYNGTAMSEVFHNTEAANHHVYVYTLVNPDVGNHNVVVDFSANATHLVSCVVLYGVDNDTPIEDSVMYDFGSNEAFRLSVDATEGAWVFCAAASSRGLTLPTHDEFYSVYVGTGLNDAAFQRSEDVSAGTYEMGWTQDGTGGGPAVAFSLKMAPPATTYTLALATTSFALTGVAVLFNFYKLVLAKGAFVLSGKALLFRKFLLALATTSFALTGVAVGFLRGYILALETGIFALTGVAVDLIYTAVTTAIKTINGLAKASVKTLRGTAMAVIKTINGLE